MIRTESSRPETAVISVIARLGACRSVGRVTSRVKETALPLASGEVSVIDSVVVHSPVEERPIVSV